MPHNSLGACIEWCWGKREPTKQLMAPGKKGEGVEQRLVLGQREERGRKRWGARAW